MLRVIETHLQQLSRTDALPIGGSIRPSERRADLEAFGIRQPGNLIYELELLGQPVERVYRNRASGTKALVGFRLRADEQTVPSPARRSRWAVIRNR